MPAYAGALVREIELWGAHRRLKVATVFLGGGTPSELPVSLLSGVLAAADRWFDLADDAEITLEANPGTVDQAYFRDLRSLGVNRLSLGVQSFDDGELQALTRIHSAGGARRAFEEARAAGFQRINLDLIYGLPRQSVAGWVRNVEEAVRLRPDHLSLYALTVEPGTTLHRQVSAGRTPGPDADVQAEMYERASGRLDEAGYHRYEISNWALPGEECRHNLVYWRNQPYLGVGCGAHSYLDGRRFAVIDPPRGYVAAVAAAVPGDPWAMPQLAEVEVIEREMELAETLMLGLRLAEGVSRTALISRFGEDALARYAPVFAELRALELIEEHSERITLSARGVLLGNEVFERVLLPA